MVTTAATIPKIMEILMMMLSTAYIFISESDPLLAKPTGGSTTQHLHYAPCDLMNDDLRCTATSGG